MTNWARKQEQQVISDFGGRSVTNSGARWHSKGDGKIQGEWIQDVKSTKKESYKVTPSVLNKLKEDADLHGCKPMLIVNFVNTGRQVVLTPEFCVEEIFEYFEDNVVTPYSHGYAIDFKGKCWNYVVLTGEAAKNTFELA